MMLENFIKDIAYCAFCPKLCRFSCPVANITGSESYTPTGKMNLLYLFLNKKIDARDLSDIIFQGCTNCLVCKNYCKWKIEISQIIQNARSIILQENLQKPEIKNILQNISSFKNPYEENLNKKLKDILSSSCFNLRNKILYFPGCKIIYYFPQNILDTIKIFERLNLNFSVPDENVCCGILNLQLGDFSGFNLLQKKNKKIFEKYNKIICSCPECTYIFKEKYALKQVFHITEIINQFYTTCSIPAFSKLSPKNKITLMYSDPCYLSRYLGIYQEPRNLLNTSNADIKEFLWNKERTRCCGGILNFINNDFSLRIAKLKIEEALSKKSDIIITSCPQCQYNLGNFKSSIEIKDIVSFLVETLKIN